MSFVTYVRKPLKEIATLPFQGQGVLVMVEDLPGNPLCDWAGTSYTVPLTTAQAAALAAGPIAAKRSITGIGDSIMGYGDNVGAGGTGTGATSQSHVAWAISQMPGAGLNIISNRGVGGTLIDGAAASSLIGTGSTPQWPLAAVDNSDILWIHSGINHLNPSIDAGTPTVAQILTKFRRLFDLVAPAKALVIVDALTPLNASAATPSGAAARRSDIPLINAGLQTLCAGYRNVKFNDIYTPMALDNAGNANPDYFTRLNGIHFTTWGAYIAGVTSAQTLLRNLYPAAAFRVSKAVTLMDFTGTAGTKTAGSGTINGSVATNLALTIAAGTGVVTASVADNKQRLVIDNSAGAVTCTVQLNFSNTASWNGTLANGDTVVAYAKIECASQTGMRRCNPTYILNPAGTPVNIDGLSKSTQELADSGPQGVVLPLFPPNFSGIFQTQPFALNAVVATMNMAVTIELAPMYYVFSVSGVTVVPTVGATYTNNAQTFTVAAFNVSGGVGTILATAAGAPSASGTLSKSGGTGDATIAFSAYVTTPGGTADVSISGYGYNGLTPL